VRRIRRRYRPAVRRLRLGKSECKQHRCNAVIEESFSLDQEMEMPVSLNMAMTAIGSVAAIRTLKISAGAAGPT
jgi:hypothetical protein